MVIDELVTKLSSTYIIGMVASRVLLYSGKTFIFAADGSPLEDITPAPETPLRSPRPTPPPPSLTSPRGHLERQILV
jgi:hypothetical protein